LPPGNHHYFFTDGKEIKIAEDQKSIINNGDKILKRETITAKKDFKF
jgi:hypothetical protein